MGGHQPDTVRHRPGGRSAQVRQRVLESARQLIADGGYGALAHRRVAEEAGVDPSTVYRRWPTRAALAVDALLSTATRPDAPDTGDLILDLQVLFDEAVGRLRSPDVRRAMLTYAVAVQEQPELIPFGQRYWHETLATSAVVVRRAVLRGEVPVATDGVAVIETLMAPLMFRSLLTGAPVDEPFRRACLLQALRLAKVVPRRARD